MFTFKMFYYIIKTKKEKEEIENEEKRIRRRDYSKTYKNQRG